MRAFRFRAAAALELRKKQEEAASIELFRRQQAAAEGQTRAVEAVRRLQDGQTGAVENAVAGTSSHELEWHRNWIVGLTTTAEALAVEAARLAREVREAEEDWSVARRKRLTLERLRERLLERHGDRAAAEERKNIDELARLRFAMGGAALAGSNDGGS